MTLARSQLDCIYLFIVLHEKYINVLEIPREDFKDFTISPLKWLRLLGYVILGVEGHLLTANGSAVDYSVTIENIESICDRYQYAFEGPPLLFDFSAMDNRTSADTTSSYRSTGFMRSIVDRDMQCLLSSGDVVNCHACHIIPHSKGSEYITRLTERRAKIEREIVHDIDDIRNGLLLHEDFHSKLDKHEFAFLKTPNFGLEASDVPNHEKIEERFTFQYFPRESRRVDAYSARFRAAFPANVDARFDNHVSADRKPSTLLLNIMYGSAALQSWGTANFSEDTRDYHERNIPEGNAVRTGQSEGNVDGSRTPPTFSTTNKDRDVGENPSSGKSDKIDYFDVMYAITMKLIPRIEVDPEEQLEIEKARSSEKVQEWFRRGQAQENE